MKKLACLALAIALSLTALVGCGGAPASNPASGPASAVSAPDSEADGEKNFEGQELNIAIFEGGYGPDYWNEIVASFDVSYPFASSHLTKLWW